METKTQIEPTVVAHAITLSGKKVLIEARGPRTTRFQRWRARRNLRKWNAERAHLVQEN